MLIDRLGYNKRAAFDILTGVGRVAVETRPELANACTYSGDCMTGCTGGSVFSALPSIQKHLESDPSVEEHIGTDHRVDFERRIVRVRSPEGSETSCPYDLLFICAGAVQSVELLTRSLDCAAESPIVDNMVLSFPVFYAGPIPSKSVGDGYFALTNGMLILRPHTKAEPTIQVQLYPNPDYFWQYNLPSWSWRAVQPLARWGRNRLFWARAYLPSSQSQHYQMRLEKNGVLLRLGREANTSPFLARIWPELRKAIADADFWVLPVHPAAAKTSAHYAGGFPMGGGIVNRDGCMGNGAHLCDSASFPTGPSPSPTLTAMANARRIARIALA